MEDGWVAFKYLAGGELKSCPVLDNTRLVHADVTPYFSAPVPSPAPVIVTIFVPSFAQ